MKRVRKETAALILEAKREGYAIANEESGPRPTTDEQREKFREYYRAAAVKRFPS